MVTEDDLYGDATARNEKAKDMRSGEEMGA